ncbi:hypothetical protein PsorP6_018130 [Peronosclerospora sorghi]|uniref:Uncharacterized protein n=1 Tax=Peronosclerospora sorghi TaxID=230839 RepID=A0ACC0WFL3_9STRA|nr:hypothetical protein PsorP6_018130 [Peronosclerospora sorghi]
MTRTIGVADPELASVALYTLLPWCLRLNLLPFIFFYVTAVYLYTVRPAQDVVPWIFGALSVFCHALAMLSAEWSVDVRCWMSCRRLQHIVEDEHVQLLVKVEPSLTMLPKQLCVCHWTPKPTGNAKRSDDPLIPTLSFSYQNIKFCLYDDVAMLKNSKVALFRRLAFPSSDTLKFYLQHKGHTSMEKLKNAQRKWGKNDFDLSMPTFGELLKEQLVAPFFVFQFFCMLLWCLDEYIYYSLLTLLMLVIFECTVVKQRQQNMNMLLQMQRTPQPCLVFRYGRWSQVLSDDLVPGDLCSVGRSEHDTVVPCDVLLLHGNCVVNESMLSGESIPLRKESIQTSIVNKEDTLQTLEIDEGTSMKHKRHVLFGGTKVLQHTAPLSKTSLRVPAPPDRGGIGYVLKTGFGTTQGSLMRTILYSSQRVTANNVEAMWFIVLLLNFAVAAAAYVLTQGINDPTRNQFKLFLHCVMIVTSVVPPELPMELSLAVTNSLIALTRNNIFCTEPFRIPAAGRIDICCFDKTGTLTSDDLKFHGVAGLKTHVEPKNSRNHCDELNITAPEQLPLDTELVLVGCQSLIVLNGELTGDPLEMTTVRTINWNLSNKRKGLLRAEPSVYSDRRGKIQVVEILHTFAFSSELKRMTTVVCVRKADNEEHDELRVLTKGAPEILESIYLNRPSNYRRVYRHFASKGCRVLALGFRALPAGTSPDKLQKIPRHELENALTFAGFLILDCPLKEDTKRTIRDLMVSKHKITMVTGDNPLTACDVAREVGINANYSKQPLILTPNIEAKTIEWKVIDDGSADVEDQAIPFNLNELPKMQMQYDLCVTGEALAMLYKLLEVECLDNAATLEKFLTTVENLCVCTTVFARMSPQQKEHLIMAMNRRGFTTSMCGDGTNDVGALKQAHIGISIVNSSRAKNNLHVDSTGREGSSVEGQGDFRHRRRPGHQRGSMNELPQSWYSEDNAQTVRLGDASIASPFTSKSSSIGVIKKLIRQGRCTLVTTIQMYKILGINCLITAYSMSALFVSGVKNGDQQLTVSGVSVSLPSRTRNLETGLTLVIKIGVQLSVAMFFLFLSRAKPARKLSHQRPPSGVFCPSVMVSIFGQFGIHLAFLAAALHLAQPYITPGDPAMHPDGIFTPNVVNSIMFLMVSIMQVTTFVANYRGQPFMEGFWENRLFCRAVLLTYGILAVLIAEIVPPLNGMLELVAMPNQQSQHSWQGIRS